VRKKLLLFCLLFLFSTSTALTAATPKQVSKQVPAKAAEVLPSEIKERYPIPVVTEPVLEQGAKGEQVTKVQQLLAESGFYAGTLDGKFGPATRGAVERFQKHYSLPVTGTVDRTMIDALQRAKGAPDRYRRVVNMEASAYTTEDPGNGSYTYRGNQLRKGLVAVDPNVIPLGARLYIEGYGYAIADDTGGYIRGNRIDLAYESRGEALQFGRRTVSVYILD
jgi:3D (Asp-Asp-Asp) domain-containing protein